MYSSLQYILFVGYLNEFDYVQRMCQGMYVSVTWKEFDCVSKVDG